MPDRLAGEVSNSIYNFGAGPAMLPTAVMQRAREEFLDWHGTGLSVMELGHRTPEFIAIAEQAEANLREILSIPDNFAILFLQGGATSQFSMVPLNLTAPGDRVDALYTGLWSGKAIKEAGRYCSVNVAASSENNHFTAIPDTSGWQLSANARYLYFTDNETVHGVEFQQTPKSGEVPLVSDMTSNLLTRPIDFSAYGLIFAGAQKNLGPAGLTLVIVREDLLGNSRQDIPRLYDYAFNAKEHSMANTPPTYSWYMAGLVLQWIKQEGGIPVMEQRAIARSSKLYQLIDASEFFSNPIATGSRSRMNIPFLLRDETLNNTFLKEAKSHGLVALAGHRSVGGMRASLYNAMPEAGVDCLAGFMADFERRYG
ncbi:MAG TPA: 3-phosphoserine/phosphohydroxythreonine transaminase [Gammaproteobacteria bacterium]